MFGCYRVTLRMFYCVDFFCYTSPVNFPESYTKDELNSSRLGFKSVTAPSTFTTLFLPAFLFAGYLPRFI